MAQLQKIFNEIWKMLIENLILGIVIGLLGIGLVILGGFTWHPIVILGVIFILIAFFLIGI